MVVRLQSGTEKKTILAPNAQAYIMSQSVELQSFQPGQYVVLKISSPINEDPWQVEVVMDTHSSKQYSSYRTISPLSTKIKAGGFATSAGPSTANVPPLTAYYPNTVYNPWGNTYTMPTGSGFGPGAGTLKANPAPFYSPAIGAVMSGSTGSSPGTSPGNSSFAQGPLTPQDGGGNGSIVPNNLNITPDKADWVGKPTEPTAKMKLVEFQGKITGHEPDRFAILVQDFNTSTVYTVIVIQNRTKIFDYTSNEVVSQDQLTFGRVVRIMGAGDANNIVRASSIRVQR
jgi:hypothetical protein